MLDQQKPTATQQVQALNAALTQALIRKEDGQAQMTAADKEIVAIRNVLAGIQLGQELQKEITPAPVPTPSA